MRECYGNYLSKEYGCHDHHNCPIAGECMQQTSITKGACDCPHKAHCHIPRQWLQAKFKDEDPSHVCSFIKYFEEDKNEL